MSDPLLLLRSALSSNSTIILLSLDPTTNLCTEVYTLPSSTHISLPSSHSSSASKVILPKSTPTRYISQGTQCYDLETLLMAYLQRESSVGEYMKSTRDAGVGFVSVTDRRGIIDYLSGKGGVEGPEGRVIPLVLASTIEQSTTDTTTSSSKRALSPSATLASQSTPVPPAQIAKKPRYVVDKTDQIKVKKLLSLMEGPTFGNMGSAGEIKGEKTGGAFKNRETVLRGERMNNFESTRLLVQPRVLSARIAIQKLTSDGKGVAALPLPNSTLPGGQKKKRPNNPIIMISPSSTALITMFNVKKFLEESIFEPSHLARLSSASSNTNLRQAEDIVFINHTRTTSATGGKLSNEGEERKTRYFVVDSVEALSKFGGIDEAWDRVVCVMTTGQEWQFKPYKWKEPKELFHHVKGVHVQWTTDAPNPKVREWNVAELRIDPGRRHIDKSTVANFWRQLETYIAKEKSYLAM